MRKKIQTTDKARADKAAKGKLGTHIIKDNAESLIDGNHDHNGYEAEKKDRVAEHGADYGVKPAITEGAARIGMQIAAMNRAVGAGGHVDHRDILATLDRLVIAPGATSQDALAFITVAKTLLAIPLSEATPLDEGDESLALFYVSDLMQRAIQTLEAVSGQSSGAYNGNSPTVN